MRRLAPFLLLLAAAPAVPAATGNAAGSAPPAVPASGAAAKDFAPAGWAIEREAQGDLNGDGRADLAMIFLDPDPAHFEPKGRDAFEMLSAGNPRILAIAFARAGGGYRLAVADAAFLPRRRRPNGLSDGFMLFEEGSLEIASRRLRIRFDYTRGHTSFLFRWQAGSLRLIGYDSAGASGGCIRTLSANFLTRRAKLTAGPIESDAAQVRWVALDAAAPPALAAIGEGEAFDVDALLAGERPSCGDR